jgi:hypothetical protein
VTDRVLRGVAVGFVAILAVPPILELVAIGHPNQRALAALAVAIGIVAGMYAGVKRRPLAARITTIVYGVVALGLGLFASNRPVPFLLAYVVGLLGMNVMLHHVATYGPVLAATREEDAMSRRTQVTALRSLAVSGGVLALTYGGSLALLPLFTAEVGSRDPVVALVLAASLVVVLMMLAVLPESPLVRGEREWRLR